MSPLADRWGPPEGHGSVSFSPSSTRKSVFLFIDVVVRALLGSLSDSQVRSDVLNDADEDEHLRTGCGHLTSQRKKPDLSDLRRHAHGASLHCFCVCLSRLHGERWGSLGEPDPVSLSCLVFGVCELGFRVKGLLSGV